MTLIHLLFRPWSGPYRRTAAEKWIRIIPLVAYMIGVYMISAVPGDRLTPVVDDRIAHTLEYFGFSMLAIFAAAGFAPQGLSLRELSGAMIFTALYALSDEFHQSFVPDRHPSVQDFAFDMLGASIAALLIWFGTRGTR